MTTQYNLGNIRTLLTEGFSVEELRSFCFDQPDFRFVYNRLAQDSGKSQIVHQLIAHANRKELFDLLLAWAEKQNPAKYKKYHPYNYTLLPNTSSSDHGKIERAELFTEWDDTFFKERLDTAEEISMLVVANYNMISKNSTRLKMFLKRGGKLRCIYLDPKGNAVKMAADRAYGLERDPNQIISLIVMSLKTMKEIASAASHTDNVQVKLVDHLPSTIMTIINHQYSDGVMFVTLNGFNIDLCGRPSFVLKKSVDERWFTFFQDTFENIWSWSEAEKIDILGNFVYDKS